MSKDANSKNVNKKDFINIISEKTGSPKSTAEALLNATMQTIVSELKEGNKVTFVGFGTFESRHRKSVQRTNPQTREKIQVPEKNVVIFKAGKTFKDEINPSTSVAQPTPESSPNPISSPSPV